MSTDMLSPESRLPIVIDGISYIPSSALLMGIPKISFKDNRAFGVLDPQGEAPRLYSTGSELGFYYNDTRYLGIWEMTFNGTVGVALAHELRFGGNTVVISMTNRDLDKLDKTGRIVRDTFLIRRVLSFCNDSLFETVELKNFDTVAHKLLIEQWAGGRFEDIFEVRGFPRPRRGQVLCSEEKSFDGQTLSILKYEGLDARLRNVFIHRLFDAQAISISPQLVGYSTHCVVPPKGVSLLKTVVSFEKITDTKFHGMSYGEISIAEKIQKLYNISHETPFAPLFFESDNAIINRSILNAQTDIYTLLTEEPETDLYPYAGVPWFSAPFGRDGIITAYQLLPWFPSVAKGVLDYVFKTLGKRFDAFTDEQPGKVFHEMRRGEMAQTREVPFIPYYGSVDATPLVLILLHEYFRWTRDLKQLEEWWPYALQALEWIETWGDLDQDGFVEYAKQSPSGLINQGWKDSGNSIMHADGKLAVAPIRLCEVQGYAFRARMDLSVLARYLGKTELALRLRREALELKSRFAERFWDSAGQYIYLAIDGDKRPCAVKTSNMGHCLWTQILADEQARSVSRILMSGAMFTGHGIRTLSKGEVAYNPLSYHNGSVWPHDNSIIMEGLRNYGYTTELEELSLGLMGVLESSQDFRLPELFCGFRKRGLEPPIPYEVACKPQAWAAGSIFLMLKSILGLSMDVDQNYLVLNQPFLTAKINTLTIRNLMIRDSKVDLLLRRTAHGTSVEVTRREGNLRVLTVK